jgi:hypothetical protein
MTMAARETEMRGLRVNVRVVLILLGLTAVICASVIVTDALSRRDRHGAATATTLGEER